MAQLLKGKQISQQTVTIKGATGNVVVQGDLDMSAYNVIISGSPTAANQAVNKAYVDSVAGGLVPHLPVHAVATGVTSLTGTTTIDGYALSVDQRVLLTNQGGTGASDQHPANGVWQVKAGAWIRPFDFDGSPTNEVSTGDFVFVEFGTVNGKTGWVLSTTDATLETEIVVNVDTQGWVKVSSPGTYSTDGEGLELGGTVFSLELDGSTLSKTASGVRVSASVMTVISNTEGYTTSLSTALSTELSTRGSADTSLSTAISSEASTRGTADTSLSTAISTETSNRVSGDTSLSTAVSNASSAGTSLSTAVSTEISTRGSADTSLSTSVSGAISSNVSLSTAVSTEISTRGSADSSLASAISTSLSSDASLSTAISSEISSRTSADSSLSTSVSGDISTEISTRASADSSLSTAISSDISSRVSGDGSLSTAVSTEASTRGSADTSLSTAISSINTGSISGVTSLSTAVSSEISSRTSADSSLATGISTAVSTEASTRSSADSSLATGISTDISTEASTRTSADSSLATAISNIQAPSYFEQLLAPANSGSSTAINVGTAFAHGVTGGVIDESTIVVFLNGIEYTFEYAQGSPAVFHTAGVTPTSTGTSLYFDGVQAGFAIEFTDDVKIKYVVTV